VHVCATHASRAWYTRVRCSFAASMLARARTLHVHMRESLLLHAWWVGSVAAWSQLNGPRSTHCRYVQGWVGRWVAGWVGLAICTGGVLRYLAQLEMLDSGDKLQVDQATYRQRTHPHTPHPRALRPPLISARVPSLAAADPQTAAASPNAPQVALCTPYPPSGHHMLRVIRLAL
jgi:hypothetical protein